MKKIIRALKKLGFSMEEGKKHTTATSKSGVKTTIPRTKLLKKGTAESICDFIIKETEIREQELLDLID